MENYVPGYDDDIEDDSGYGYETHSQPQNVSLKEFYKHYAPASFYKRINRCSLMLFLLAAGNGLILTTMPFNVPMWMDVLLMSGWGYALRAHKRERTALAIIIYAVADLIFGAFMPLDGYGELVLLVTGVVAKKAFLDARKVYDSRARTGEAYY